MSAMPHQTSGVSAPDEHRTGEHLLIDHGMGRPAVVALGRNVVHIGRGFGADVRLDDHTVSRRHALLVRTSDGTRLIEHRSANGTYVNGQRVGDVTLADGDVITLGRTRVTYCNPALTSGGGLAASPAAAAAWPRAA